MSCHLGRRRWHVMPSWANKDGMSCHLGPFKMACNAIFGPTKMACYAILGPSKMACDAILGQQRWHVMPSWAAKVSTLCKLVILLGDDTYDTYV